MYTYLVDMKCQSCNNIECKIEVQVTRFDLYVGSTVVEKCLVCKRQRLQKVVVYHSRSKYIQEFSSYPNNSCVIH
jgi:hypothetical protein